MKNSHNRVIFLSERFAEAFLVADSDLEFIEALSNLIDDRYRDGDSTQDYGS